MLKFHHDRTRRIPRTAAEAFPHSCDYACAVHRTRSAWRGLNRDEWVAMACIVALLTAAPFIWPGLVALVR